MMESMRCKEKIPKGQEMMECRSYQGNVLVLLVANARIKDTTLGPVKGKEGINLRSDYGYLLWCNDYLVSCC